MKGISKITKEDFRLLLTWLDQDSSRSAAKYEQIRKGLERYFRFRGCNDPLFYADETINRVAVKIGTLDLSQDVKEISIFYGFAVNVYKEYLRKIKAREITLNPDFNLKSIDSRDGGQDAVTEARLDCLDRCLEALSEENRDLVMNYYREDKSAKIKNRKMLAEKLEIRSSTLNVKVHRIRNGLGKCIKKCLKNKDA